MSSDPEDIYKKLALSIMEVISSSNDLSVLRHKKDIEAINSLLKKNEYYYIHMKNPEDEAMVNNFKENALFLYHPLVIYLVDNIKFDIELYKYGETFSGFLKKRFAIITRNNFYSSTTPIEKFNVNKAKDKSPYLNATAKIFKEEYDEKNKKNEWKNPKKKYRVRVEYITRKNTVKYYYFFLNNEEELDLVYKMLRNIQLRNNELMDTSLIKDIEKVITQTFITYATIKILSVKRKMKNKKILKESVNNIIKEDRQKFSSFVSSLAMKTKTFMQSQKKFQVYRELKIINKKYNKIKNNNTIAKMKKSIKVIADNFIVKRKSNPKNKCVGLKIINSNGEEDVISINRKTNTISFEKAEEMSSEKIRQISSIIIDGKKIKIYGGKCDNIPISVSYKKYPEEVFYDVPPNTDSIITKENTVVLRLFHFTLDTTEFPKFKDNFYLVEIIFGPQEEYSYKTKVIKNSKIDKNTATVEVNSEYAVTTKSPRVNIVLYGIKKSEFTKENDPTMDNVIIDYLSKEMISSAYIDVNDKETYSRKLSPLRNSTIVYSILPTNEAKNYNCIPLNKTLRVGNTFYLIDMVNKSLIDSLKENDDIPKLIKKERYSNPLGESKSMILCVYLGTNIKKEILLFNYFTSEVMKVPYSKKYIIPFQYDMFNIFNMDNIEKIEENDCTWVEEFECLGDPAVVVEMIKKLRRQVNMEAYNESVRDEASIEVENVYTETKKEMKLKAVKDHVYMRLIIDKVEFKESYSIESNCSLKIGVKNNETDSQLTGSMLIGFLRNNSVMKDERIKKLFDQYSEETKKKPNLFSFEKVVQINADSFNKGEKTFFYRTEDSSKREVKVRHSKEVNFVVEVGDKCYFSFINTSGLANGDCDYYISPICDKEEIVGILTVSVIYDSNSDFESLYNEKIKKIASSDKEKVNTLLVGRTEVSPIKKQKLIKKSIYNKKRNDFYVIFAETEWKNLMKRDEFKNGFPDVEELRKMKSRNDPVYNRLITMMYMGIPQNYVVPVYSSYLQVGKLLSLTQEKLQKLIPDKKDQFTTWTSIYNFLSKLSRSVPNPIEIFIDLDGSPTTVKSIIKTYFKWTQLNITLYPKTPKYVYFKSLNFLTSLIYNVTHSPPITFVLLVGMSQLLDMFTVVDDRDSDINDVYTYFTVLKVIMQSHHSDSFLTLCSLGVYNLDLLLYNHMTSFCFQCLSQEVAQKVLDVIIFKKSVSDDQLGYLRFLCALVFCAISVEKIKFSQKLSDVEAIINKGMYKSRNVQLFMKNVNEKENQYFYKGFMDFSSLNASWDSKKKTIQGALYSMFTCVIEDKNAKVKEATIDVDVQNLKKAIKKNFPAIIGMRNTVCLKVKRITKIEGKNDISKIKLSVNGDAVDCNVNKKGYISYDNFFHCECNQKSSIAIGVNDILFTIHLQNAQISTVYSVEIASQGYALDVSFMMYIASSIPNDVGERYSMIFEPPKLNLDTSITNKITSINNEAYPSPLIKDKDDLQAIISNQLPKLEEFFIQRNILDNYSINPSSSLSQNAQVVISILSELVQDKDMIQKIFSLLPESSFPYILLSSILEKCSPNINETLLALYFFTFAFPCLTLPDVVYMLFSIIEIFIPYSAVKQMINYILGVSKKITKVCCYKSSEAVETNDITQFVNTAIEYYKNSCCFPSFETILGYAMKKNPAAANDNMIEVVIERKYSEEVLLFKYDRETDTIKKVNDKEYKGSNIYELLINYSNSLIVKNDLYYNEKIDFECFKNIIFQLPYIGDALRKKESLKPMKTEVKRTMIKSLVVVIRDKENALTVDFSTKGSRGDIAIPFSCNSFNTINEIIDLINNKLRFTSLDNYRGDSGVLKERLSKMNFEVKVENNRVNPNLPFYLITNNDNVQVDIFIE